MDLLATICVGVLSFFGLANVVYGLPHFIAVIVLRPVVACMIAVICSALIVAALSAVVGEGGPLANAAVMVAFLPFPVYWLVGLWAWSRADDQRRIAAWRIRQEIADRYEEPIRQKVGWYPTAVYDLERLRRREIYEAPAIN